VKRKRYSRKFLRMAVERLRSSDNIGDLAKELGVGRRCLYKWQAKLDPLEPGEEAPRTSSHESSYRQQVHRLKRLLAEKTLEVDFFRGAVHSKATRPTACQLIEKVCSPGGTICEPFDSSSLEILQVFGGYSGAKVRPHSRGRPRPAKRKFETQAL
jgi:transposase-like protein